MTGFPTPAQTVQSSRTGNISHASQTVGQVAVLLLPQLPKETSLVRVTNVSPSGGPTLWISRHLGMNVAPNAPGAIPLPPGMFEKFAIPELIPTNPIYAIADGPGCAATVEFG